MWINEFRVVERERRIITTGYAKLERYYTLQQKKKGFFGRIKWVDFWIRSYYGDDPGRDYPEFKTLEAADKYMKELKGVLK